MRIRLVIGSLIALVAVAPSLGETPLSTAFTYQGQLKQGGVPLNGNVNLEFRLFDALTDGTLVGPLVAKNGVPVTNGLFTVDLDFGVEPFTGQALFLEIAVRLNTAGAFTTLSPRQALTPTPYAIRALIDETFGLPFAATIDRPEDAFSITNLGGNAVVGSVADAGTAAVRGTNTGQGQAGVFQTTNGLSVFPALEASTNASAAAFRSANLGIGPAAVVEIANAGNGSTALVAGTNGLGSAAFLLATNAQNANPVLLSRTAGLGEGGVFDLTNAGNAAPALVAQTNGVGSAGLFAAFNVLSNSPTLFAGTIGTGSAADLRTGAGAVFLPGNPTATLSALNSRDVSSAAKVENSNIDNSDEALLVKTLGRGSAAVFIIDNPDPGASSGNPSDALFAKTNGLGRAGFFAIDVNPGPASSISGGGPNNISPALEARTDGDGPAGRFSISNPDGPSTANALEATTEGLGGAARFEVFTINSEAAALTSATRSAETGQAAFFTSASAVNTGTTVEVIHTGLGTAGSFQTPNPTNGSATLTTTTRGLGRAASFTIENADPDNVVNAAPTMEARTKALGPAGRFIIDLPTGGTGQGPVNNSPAVHATTNASGNAAKFESTNSDFVNPTLEVTSQGKGTVGRFVSNNTTSAAATIVGQTQGLGSVADFTNFNSNNLSAVLNVSTNAAGNASAASFQNTNPANSGDVVAALANNSRHALFARQSGPGEAAHFEIADPGNGNNAVFIKNNGVGVALSVENGNPNVAALALAVRGKSAFNGQVDILSSTGGPVPVNITGNVGITGELCATSVCAAVKNFRIDHPLDPENKYLYHASVESSEMKNMYDGTVVLDENGRATVALPAWFEALNESFRYQLTAVGQPAPNVHIGREIGDGQFQIAGGPPRSKVSWQVTGVRKDVYARANPLWVEAEKPATERGKYLVPEAYSVSKERPVNYRPNTEQPAPTAVSEAIPR